MTTEKKKSRAKAEPLDRDRIALAALSLVDELGIAELSMRKLGTALGVEAMALYYYFSNKAELVDGILDVMLKEVSEKLPRTGSPLEQIRATFDALRGMAIDHPQAYATAVSRRFATQRSLEFYEELLGLFAAAGLSPEQSARYYRMMANFTAGAGIADVGSRAQQADATPIILEDFQRADEFPRITEVMPHLRVARLDHIYNAGMELFFTSLKLELAGISLKS